MVTVHVVSHIHVCIPNAILLKDAICLGFPMNMNKTVKIFNILHEKNMYFVKLLKKKSLIGIKWMLFAPEFAQLTHLVSFNVTS